MRSEIIKQLECLFAWSDFYAKNERWDDYEKSQVQIMDFKIKHGLR